MMTHQLGSTSAPAHRAVDPSIGIHVTLQDTEPTAGATAAPDGAISIASSMIANGMMWRAVESKQRCLSHSTSPST